MPLRVLCVDEEAGSRERLENLLIKMPGISRVAAAGSSDEARELLSVLEPHVMMLDVELSDGTAFDLLERIDDREVPAVVFVTAHEEYALRAFDVPALDYILKPVGAQRVRTALDRVRTRLQAGDTDTRRSNGAGGQPIADAADEFWVRKGGALMRVPAASIHYATSADDYVCLHADGQEYLLRHSLNRLAERLPKGDFVRIHRSALVRLSSIAEFRTDCEGRKIAVMSDGAQLKVGGVLGRRALGESAVPTSFERTHG